MSKSRRTVIGVESHNSGGAMYMYNDTSICDTDSATVKISNSNPNKMEMVAFLRADAKSMLQQEAAALVISPEGLVIMACFHKFDVLLKYIKPESLKSDVKNLQDLAFDNSLTDAQLTSTIGHLFGDFEETHLQLPEEDDAWFPNSNSYFLTKLDCSRRPPTKKDKLRRMVKQFKRSLNKAIVKNRKIADILLRYVVLIVHLENPHSLPDESVVPISDGSTAVGTRQHWLQKIKELEVDDNVVEECLAYFFKFEAPIDDANLENYAITEPDPDQQRTGVSTLTDSQAHGAEEKEEE